MKIIITFLATTGYLLCSAASAQSCGALFNEGNKIGAETQAASNIAAVQFQKMKQLAQNNAADATLCETGRDARRGGFLSARKAKRAREIWLQAIQTCSPPNDQEAATQADKFTGIYNTQISFVSDMDDLLVSKCDFQRLTPLLNQ